MKSRPGVTEAARSNDQKLYEKGRAQRGPTATTTATTGVGQINPEEYLRGLLIEALADCEYEQWLRRADEFERARPRLGEFSGPGADFVAADARCAETARACRSKAAVIGSLGVDEYLNAAAVDRFLAEGK